MDKFPSAPINFSCFFPLFSFLFCSVDLPSPCPWNRLFRFWTVLHGVFITQQLSVLSSLPTEILPILWGIFQTSPPLIRCFTQNTPPVDSLWKIFLVTLAIANGFHFSRLDGLPVYFLSLLTLIPPLSSRLWVIQLECGRSSQQISVSSA